MDEITLQAEQLCNIVVDAETGVVEIDGDILDRIKTIQNEAAHRRNNGRNETVEIPEDLQPVITSHLQKAAENRFRQNAMSAIERACRDSGALAGSAEFFADRIANEDGVPMIRTNDGRLVPVSPAAIKNELPPSLFPGRRAMRADREQDLREQVETKQAEYDRLSRLHAQSGGGNNTYLHQASAARRELKQSQAELDQLRAEKRAEMAPAPKPTRVPTAAELGRLHAIGNQRAAFERRYKANPDDRQAMTAWSRVNKQYKTFASEIGAS